MQIDVSTTKVDITQTDIINKGEYGVNECVFTFSQEYEGLSKKAIFTTDINGYLMDITDNTCSIPSDVLKLKGNVGLGVYAYENEGDKLLLRYSPAPAKFFVTDGSYIENTKTVMPEEALRDLADKVNDLVNEIQQKLDDGEFDGEDGEDGVGITNIVFNQDYTLTVTLTDGRTFTSQSLKGEKGDKGEPGQDGYSPVRGVDYWTEQDKQEVITEATSSINGKLEEYNSNAESKTNAFNQNAENKTTSFNNNATSKTTDFNQNATTKTTDFNDNYTQKLTDFNDNAAEKTDDYNTNAQDKLDAFNENAEEKTQDFDEHTAAMQAQIDELTAENQKLQTEIDRDRATYPTITGSGENITLSKTAELEFIQPPLPRGNSEQVQYSGKNLANGNMPVNLSLPANQIFYTLCDFQEPQTFEKLTITLFLNNVVFTNQSGAILNITNSDDSVTYKVPGNFNLYTGSAKTGTYKLTLENITLKKIGVYTQSYWTPTQGTITAMVESGTGTDTYEPYVGGTASPNPSYPQAITNVTGDVEVLVQNKNLFDRNASLNGWQLTKENYQNGIKLTSTANSGVCYIKYTFPFVHSTVQNIYLNFIKSGTGFVNIYFYDENGNATRSTANQTSSFSLSNIPVTTKTVDIYFYGDTSATGKVTIFDNIQLELNTTETTYTPHKEQTYTFPLGTQRMFLGDYLADDGIHHVRGQIELDGSNDEEWQRNGTTQGYSVLADNVGGTANTSVIPKILCNKLIAVKQSAIYGGTANNGISSQSDTQRIYVRINEAITTVELLKQWLAENPITVEYELAEEEITPYTTEQQQAYDEIKQAFSYEEQTNISGSSDESNPLFSVEAYQSTKLVLEEISNAVVALGGV